jgi:hypothetical protein
MSFTMGRLLVHDESVPAAARAALRAAYDAHPEERDAMLASAARILHHEADLDCRDALEIVDLSERCGCDE